MSDLDCEKAFTGLSKFKEIDIVKQNAEDCAQEIADDIEVTLYKSKIETSNVKLVYCINNGTGCTCSKSGFKYDIANICEGKTGNEQQNYSSDANENDLEMYSSSSDESDQGDVGIYGQEYDSYGSSHLAFSGKTSQRLTPVQRNRIAVLNKINLLYQQFKKETQMKSQPESYVETRLMNVSHSNEKSYKEVDSVNCGFKKCLPGNDNEEHELVNNGAEADTFVYGNNTYEKGYENMDKLKGCVNRTITSDYKNYGLISGNNDQESDDRPERVKFSTSNHQRQGNNQHKEINNDCYSSEKTNIAVKVNGFKLDDMHNRTDSIKDDVNSDIVFSKYGEKYSGMNREFTVLSEGFKIDCNEILRGSLVPNNENVVNTPQTLLPKSYDKNTLVYPAEHVTKPCVQIENLDSIDSLKCDRNSNFKCVLYAKNNVTNCMHNKNEVSDINSNCNEVAFNESSVSSEDDEDFSANATDSDPNDGADCSDCGSAGQNDSENFSGSIAKNVSYNEAYLQSCPVVPPPVVLQDKVSLPVVLQEKVSPPVVLQDKISPQVLQDKASSPVVLQDKVSLPVVLQDKASLPVVLQNKPSPPVVLQEKPSPPVVLQDKPSPPVVLQDKPSPPVVLQDKASPPVVLQDAATPKVVLQNRILKYDGNFFIEESINGSSKSCPTNYNGSDEDTSDTDTSSDEDTNDSSDEDTICTDSSSDENASDTTEESDMGIDESGVNNLQSESESENDAEAYEDQEKPSSLDVSEDTVQNDSPFKSSSGERVPSDKINAKVLQYEEGFLKSQQFILRHSIFDEFNIRNVDESGSFIKGAESVGGNGAFDESVSYHSLDTREFDEGNNTVIELKCHGCRKVIKDTVYRHVSRNKCCQRHYDMNHLRMTHLAALKAVKRERQRRLKLIKLNDEGGNRVKQKQEALEKCRGCGVEFLRISSHLYKSENCRDFYDKSELKESKRRRSIQSCRVNSDKQRALQAGTTQGNTLKKCPSCGKKFLRLFSHIAQVAQCKMFYGSERLAKDVEETRRLRTNECKKRRYQRCKEEIRERQRMYYHRTKAEGTYKKKTNKERLKDRPLEYEKHLQRSRSQHRECYWKDPNKNRERVLQHYRKVGRFNRSIQNKDKEILKLTEGELFKKMKIKSC